MMKLLNILRDLASTCRDAEEGYNKAAKGAHSDGIRNACAELRSLHDGSVIGRACPPCFYFAGATAGAGAVAAGAAACACIS
jgi:hypothetical protein